MRRVVLLVLVLLTFFSSCRKLTVKASEDTAVPWGLGEPVEVEVPCSWPVNWISAAGTSGSVSTYVNPDNSYGNYEIYGYGSFDYSLEFADLPDEGYYISVGSNTIAAPDECEFRILLGWNYYYPSGDTVYVQSQNDSLKITWCDLNFTVSSTNYDCKGYLEVEI